MDASGVRLLVAQVLQRRGGNSVSDRNWHNVLRHVETCGDAFQHIHQLANPCAKRDMQILCGAACSLVVCSTRSLHFADHVPSPLH